MPGVILRAIVQKLVAGTLQCHRMISSDGITARNFTIDKLQGIFVGASIDADLSKRNIPCLGNTIGIAKNLDEYQLKICFNISSFSDADPAKLHLQKFRIGIIASFAVLTLKLMSADADNGLRNWNFFASRLLRKASEFVSDLDTNIKSTRSDHDSYLEETFRFFEVPLADIQIAMANVYYQS
jgi:hypothetical protein